VGEVFSRYDQNGDGVLDQLEVAAMIASIGYDVDSAYTRGVMDMFGAHDRDGDGQIELAEFPALWAQLSDEKLDLTNARMDTTKEVFAQFDANNDGLLDQSEIDVLRRERGASTIVIAPDSGGFGLKLEMDCTVSGIGPTKPPSAARRAGVQLGMRVVAVNGSGVNGHDDITSAIQKAVPGTPVEFTFLPPEETPPPPPSPPEPALPPPQLEKVGATLLEETSAQAFVRWDTNRDGVLQQGEVAAMIAAIGYDVDHEYVGGVIQMFGRYDEDGSSSIEIAEFAPLWAQLGGKPAVDRPETEGDNFLNGAEADDYWMDPYADTTAGADPTAAGRWQDPTVTGGWQDPTAAGWTAADPTTADPSESGGGHPRSGPTPAGSAHQERSPRSPRKAKNTKRGEERRARRRKYRQRDVERDAAVRLQSHFRRKLVQGKMEQRRRQPDIDRAWEIYREPKPRESANELAAYFEEDEDEETKAASKIQAAFRGGRSRRMVARERRRCGRQPAGLPAGHQRYIKTMDSRLAELEAELSALRLARSQQDVKSDDTMDYEDAARTTTSSFSADNNSRRRQWGQHEWEHGAPAAAALDRTVRQQRGLEVAAIHSGGLDDRSTTAEAWRRVYDQNSGQWYYYLRSTGAVSWRPPSVFKTGI
jgi:Ca2+-binding EF-hand superfamily protein